MGQGQNEVIASQGSLNTRESGNPEEMKSERLERFCSREQDNGNCQETKVRKQRSIRPEQDSVSTPLRPKHHHGGSRNNVKAKTGRTMTEHWLLDRKWLLQQGIHNSWPAQD